ncbi:carboxymethylenebutenolidase [Trichodelitschia bisporula]|uniref:Carboxymethylenebutenolidase n=1 Tax=Trichodelitschia bisporula TaxID=703511 RepID=A0A6G1I8J4_9PEZI|nr:carboxymethylenebutenolidase [Trichodelitschia bisporula]
MTSHPLHSAACCSVPAVVTKGYEPKGTYTTVDGLKTYVTGPASAKHAILVVYDVFGYFPQTLQGADILAHGDAERPYRVYIPDFFDGPAADITWYPPDTKEKGEKLGNFFNTTAAPPRTVPRVPKVVEELSKANPDIQSWGVVGYCWGGKIVNLTSQSGTPFKAAAICHPAMVDPADAPKVTIPIAVLPSMDEDKKTIGEYEAALKVKHIVKWFPDQIHGWMAARSNLEDPKVEAEYKRGYKILLDFFHENL